MPSAQPSAPWKRWYKLARWEQTRQTVFARDLFTCKMAGCGILITERRMLVCDHVRPHRGDERLFWSQDNLQTLCKSCHDKRKQAEEQGSLHQRGVWH